MKSTLPPHKYLLCYRYAEIIHDGTVEFTVKFLDRFKHRRTKEQMDQAARSGKQNIIEGSHRGLTSKKSEIELLDVARASLEELTSDYEDFLRQNGFQIWAKTDMRVSRLRELGFHLSSLRNLSDLGELLDKLVLPQNPQEAANLMLTFCHQNSYLLFKFIKSVENQIITNGGYSENLHRRREEFRKKETLC